MKSVLYKNINNRLIKQFLKEVKEIGKNLTDIRIDVMDCSLLPKDDPERADKWLIAIWTIRESSAGRWKEINFLIEK